VKKKKRGKEGATTMGSEGRKKETNREKGKVWGAPSGDHQGGGKRGGENESRYKQS